MKERGIMPSVVENTIKHGTPSAGKHGTIDYYDPINKVQVAISTTTNKVVTVMKRKK